MENKFCTNCGAELNENQKFCIHCGVKVGKAANEFQNNVNSIPIFDEATNDVNIPFSNYYSDMQDENKNITPQNNIIKSLILFFKNTLDFKGRTRRSDFFQAIIPIVAIYFIVSLVCGFINDDNLAIFIILYPVVFAVPLASSIVRRLHDTGKNGLFILLLALGPIGIVAVLLLCMKDSDEDDNEYGKSVKYINNNYIPNV